jgi:copper chaperone
VTRTLHVAGMTCGHCVRAVTGAIQARDPGAKVDVDLVAGVVKAETSLGQDDLVAAIAAEGYTVSA